MLKKLIKNDIKTIYDITNDLYSRCPSDYGLMSCNCGDREDVDCVYCWRQALLREKERRQLIDEQLNKIKNMFWNKLKFVASNNCSEGWDFNTVSKRNYIAFSNIQYLLYENTNIDFKSHLNNVEQAFLDNFRIADLESATEEEKCEQYFDILRNLAENIYQYLNLQR